MDYHDIPDYHKYKCWQTANGDWEVKLTEGFGETVLHLVEDDDAPTDRIEDGLFYLDVESGVGTNLCWIRERKGIEMAGDIVDADYVELWTQGRLKETQHNHTHLDNNVAKGRTVPLTPI